MLDNLRGTASPSHVKGGILICFPVYHPSQGYKRQAVRSPVFITLEVISELILP